METKKVQLFNGDAIESVNVNVTEGDLVSRLTYKEEKNSFFCKRKAGFYYDLSGKYYGTAEDLLNGSYNGYRIIVKDNVAYWRPFVEVRMISGNKTGKHFDTISECNEYARGIMDKFVKRQFWVDKD